MWQYLLVLVFILSFGIAGIFSVARDNIFSGERLNNTAHAYDDEKTPLKRINVHIFYVIPKDKSAFVFEDLLPSIKEVADKLVNFHETTFSDKSAITYSIYPAGVIGNFDTKEYNSDDSSHGNPNALNLLYEEIEKRAFSPDGDLAKLIEKRDGSYRVIYIIYEGVGAAGAEGAALLNRRYLTDPEYESNKDGYFAHEFYHTIGLPDGYDRRDDISTTPDIMGLLRDTGLGSNFIMAETLKRMGL